MVAPKATWLQAHLHLTMDALLPPTDYILNCSNKNLLISVRVSDIK